MTSSNGKFSALLALCEGIWDAIVLIMTSLQCATMYVVCCYDYHCTLAAITWTTKHVPWHLAKSFHLTCVPIINWCPVTWQRWYDNNSDICQTIRMAVLNFIVNNTPIECCHVRAYKLRRAQIDLHFCHVHVLMRWRTVDAAPLSTHWNYGSF